MKNVKNEAEPKVIKQDVLVSNEEWREYRQVQESGSFNMLDPIARHCTSLSKEQWYHIIQNYQYFINLYGK